MASGGSTHWLLSNEKTFQCNFIANNWCKWAVTNKNKAKKEYTNTIRNCSKYKYYYCWWHFGRQTNNCNGPQRRHFIVVMMADVGKLCVKMASMFASLQENNSLWWHLFIKRKWNAILHYLFAFFLFCSTFTDDML